MHSGAAHMHVVAPSAVRQDTAAQRKRPKYTRSKTGCLTCRGKKIKCDETKPTCVRCSHGQRECTWPEGVPARKKPSSRRSPPSPVDSAGTRPSTAGSSGLSDAASPPTRGPSPTRRAAEPIEMGLPPMVSRRQRYVHCPVTPISTSQGYPMHSNNTHHLPAIPEMSAHYTNQAQYIPNYSPASHHYPHSHSHSALPRITSHHDVHHSSRNAGSASPDSQWPSPQLMTPVDPIEPYFPSPQERNLIRHYCDNALSIIMAYPSENPVLAANFHFLFDGVRGADSAVESLRSALLSFLLSRSGVSKGAAEEALRVAESFRAKSKTLLTSACATTEGSNNDAALASAVAIALIDIFSAGRHWREDMDFAKNLVKSRGGPGLLLARSKGFKDNSVTGTCRARLLLEILAVYELGACFGRGSAPTLLNIDCWWLTKTNTHDTVSYIDRVFGMSREFILVLAQVATLVARVLHPQTSRVTEIIDDLDAPVDGHAACVREAEALYKTLSSWATTPDQIQSRVDAGNCAYSHASQICLLRDVLGAQPSDAVVQTHADTILALCADCGNKKMGVDLTWPVIIAGSQTFGADRARVLSVFELFRCACVRSVVINVWQRLDAGHPQADFRSVMRAHELDVLIM
ncbi:fungal-specific transcription factor domain-containing protein [Epithele typhae]|uniref:fungal-specific transcription factor domain-containing protein n=1 Tax=Epithele typhae TaxID=378194 RepID=UPI0020089930|nr:fungal-specific transcription factor domain-containing protein [Epithele typhae]KAH9931091.1 fungal-specific transcription factor domain-containing protein [Epithele typhae]